MRRFIFERKVYYEKVFRFYLFTCFVLVPLSGCVGSTPNLSGTALTLCVKGDFLDSCGTWNIYSSTSTDVLWVLSTGTGTESFNLSNLDGSVRTKSSEFNEFPLKKLQELYDFKAIYYDKDTGIKYIVDRRINSAKPMLKADGSFDVYK